MEHKTQVTCDLSSGKEFKIRMEGISPIAWYFGGKSQFVTG